MSSFRSSCLHGMAWQYSKSKGCRRRSRNLICENQESPSIREGKVSMLTHFELQSKVNIQIAEYILGRTIMN
ncbi:hypothetical protein SCG7109_AA_00410 [Chlamydiales bacterium SCGC AG-110-M15]|nr:hypothetical protein SCG7109_AA_00410 [Chlamydiales bacterium SCGC AG-110-M15]